MISERGSRPAPVLELVQDEVPASVSPPKPPPMQVDPFGELRQLSATLRGLIMVKLQLTAALMGAFTLALMAMRSGTLENLAVLGLYCLFAVCPVVFLDLKRK